MSGRIRRCPEDATYTLLPRCPRCGGPTRTAHPVRFSMDDRWGAYRRVARGWTR